jgi:hypothetical protein
MKTQSAAAPLIYKAVRAGQRRNPEKKLIARIIDAERPRKSLNAEKAYVRLLSRFGVAVPSKAEARDRHLSFEKMMRKVRAVMIKARPKSKTVQNAKLLTVAPNAQAAFPFCLPLASSCEAGGHGNGCDARQALLKLQNRSNGLGGWVGVLAIPDVPPLTGSLFYTVDIPQPGWLNAIAEVSLTGTISCRSDMWTDCGELPTVYGDAKLLLSVIIHTDPPVRKDMLIQEVHSKPFPGVVSTFNADMNVVIAGADVASQTLLIEVQANLWAFGRSDYGYAILDFASEGFGIQVPEMCFAFFPDGPIQ